MDPTLKAVIFTIACAIFLVAGLAREKAPWWINVAVGLAFFSFVFVWDAWEAT
jgi:hypothetical protein